MYYEQNKEIVGCVLKTIIQGRINKILKQNLGQIFLNDLILGMHYISIVIQYTIFM